MGRKHYLWGPESEYGRLPYDLTDQHLENLCTLEDWEAMQEQEDGVDTNKTNT